MRTMTIIAIWALIQAIFCPHYAYASSALNDSQKTLAGSLNPVYSIQGGMVRYGGKTKSNRVIINGQYISALQSIKTRQRPRYSIVSYRARRAAKPANIKPFARVVVVTAYSSTPDQTDSTPFITAAGTRVRDGIVAANFLPFGTRVKFPEMYGDKVFVVEDRMARRFSHRMDIWFPDRQSALQFGKRRLRVVVLES